MTATDVIPGDGSVPRVAVRGIALAILVHNLPVLVWARPILAVELALKSIIRRIVEILVLIREREREKKKTNARDAGRQDATAAIGTSAYASAIVARAWIRANDHYAMIVPSS